MCEEYVFSFPEPKNYDELKVWQTEAKGILRLLRNQLEDAQTEASNLRLQVTDLEEWTTTFAPYGCEPQACLHTLLNPTGPGRVPR